MTTTATLRVVMVDEASPTAAKIVAAQNRLNAAQLRSAQAAQVVARSEIESAQAAVLAAESVEDLWSAELKAGQASERLAREEIKAAQAAARLAAANEEAANSGQNLGNASNQARSGLFGVTDAAKKQGFAMAGQVNAVAELAFNFGNLSPATRGLGMAFVMAGGNAFAFAGMLGPLGVVLGVMVGIIPGIIDLVRHLGDEMEDSSSRAAQLAGELAEVRNQRLQDMRALEEQRAIERGEADSDVIEAEIFGADQRAREASARRQSLGRLAAQVGTDGGFLGAVGNLGAVGDLVGDLFGQIGEGQGLGKFRGSGGFGELSDFADNAVAAARGEERSATNRAADLRDRALPIALAREEQERLEEQVGQERERQSLAARAFAQELDDIGISGRRRQAIEQAAGSGRADIELPALVRGLPADVRDRIWAGADLVADANAGASRAQIEADAGPLRELEQARRDRRALGERQGTVTIDSRGGAGGAARSEFSLAETSVPGVEAVGRETNDLLREMIREQRLTRENARRTTTRVDAGPDPLGDSG
ncbi:MAG: hypothetical protein JJ863_21360 [Deltaproteobacteria bacterium]|nr:hypothetical protein [Deltaproteobacteria bacterium]